jgi:hypothetical protein
MAGMDEDNMVPVAAIKEEVAEWMDRHEPLSRAALNTVDSRFMRTVGDPARMASDLENMGGVTEKNPHMRVASPSESGVFADEEDVVLLELDEDQGVIEQLPRFSVTDGETRYRCFSVSARRTGCQRPGFGPLRRHVNSSMTPWRMSGAGS